jgi:hypothetical protein
MTPRVRDPARKVEFVSVREAAQLLDKTKSRIYEMAAEGLLEQVGLTVTKTEKGRVWIGIPNAASLL